MSKSSTRALRRKFSNAVIEPLELRRLLSATISGEVYADFNGNGVKDAGENGASFQSQKVFLDQNDNGVADPGEQSTSVDQFGDYFFSNLLAGTYRVRLQQDQGFARTGPSTDSVQVTVTANQNATGPNFGIDSATYVNGNVYNDANGNGKQDSSEPALQGATAFEDINNNGTADSSSSTISSTNVPKTAAGFTTVASNLTVSGLSGLVLGVTVKLNITSPNDNDPDVFLENPQGVRVELVSPVDTASQDTGHNFVNTVFDDSSATPISKGVAPFTGTFSTTGLNDNGFGLASMNNLSPNGTWRLLLADTSTGNTATLTSWSITLKTGDPKATTQLGGYYYIPTYPGTYKVRVTDTNFITTSPSSGVITNSLSQGDAPVDNFELREVNSTAHTVTLASPVNLAKGTEDSPFALQAFDFNKDSKLDLATVNNGSNDVSIYIGNGDGTFKAPVFYPVGMAPRGLVAGDFNGDGNQDLAVTNHDNSSVSILLGNGDGTFKAAKSYAAGSGAWFVSTADFNGDKKLDLVVSDQGSNTISILTGKGDGTFNTAVPIVVGNTPQSVKIADINGDGKLDLVTANADDGNISVLLGNGNATFKSPIKINVGNDPVGLNIADFNGDGKQDVVVANGGDDTISVLLGKGDGTFQPEQVYQSGNTPAAVNLGDINKDGKTDLIVSNRGDGTANNQGDVRIFLSNGDGTFQPPYIFTTHTSPVFAAAADYNGDGKIDLAVANFFSDDITILKNTTTVVSPVTTGSISGIVYNDANSSGKQDTGENGVAGRVIYIDSNKDGLLDNGEKSTTTDSAGKWSFTGLAGGMTYRVREQNTLGFQHSQPVSSANYYDVALSNGQNVTGDAFGDHAFTPSPKPIFQVDAGSSAAFIANNGLQYSADTGFTGGTAGSNIYDVAGTDNDPYYYTYRSGTSFSYSFNVANGNYKLTLVFADPTKTAAGQRVFSVKAQGATVLSNFDIVAAAGAKTATSRTFNVSVTNGKLTLAFASTVDQAIVSGIQLYPA